MRERERERERERGREREYVGNDVGQGRVAEPQPTTRSDSVCLVLELVWGHLVEILETGHKRKRSWNSVFIPLISECTHSIYKKSKT